MNALTIKGGDGNELILDDEVLEITTAILLYKHRKISLSGAAKLLGLP
jgi:predicted HTH domain antitoxin